MEKKNCESREQPAVIKNRPTHGLPPLTVFGTKKHRVTRLGAGADAIGAEGSGGGQVLICSSVEGTNLVENRGK